VREYSGSLVATGTKIALIVSRFNRLISQRLLEGAIDEFRRLGGKEEDIDVFWAPGAFEIPQVLKVAIMKGGYDGIACLGVVLRGETPHFEYVAAEVTRGIGVIAREQDIPVTFGILTADDELQAMNRAGIKMGNKGAEAVRAVLELINLRREVLG